MQQITTNTTYIVTLSYDAEGYINKINIVPKEVDKEQEKNNQANKVEEKTEDKVQKDESISTEKIPNTGTSVIGLIILVTLLMCIMFITYIKLNKTQF